MRRNHSKLLLDPRATERQVTNEPSLFRRQERAVYDKRDYR